MKEPLIIKSLINVPSYGIEEGDMYHVSKFDKANNAIEVIGFNISLEEEDEIALWDWEYEVVEWRENNEDEDKDVSPCNLESGMLTYTELLKHLETRLNSIENMDGFMRTLIAYMADVDATSYLKGYQDALTEFKRSVILSQMTNEK